MIEDDRINNIMKFTLKKFGVSAKYHFIKLNHEDYVNFFKGVILIESLVLEFMNSNIGPEGMIDCIADYKREHGKTSSELSKEIEKVPATLITRENFYYFPQSIKENIFNIKSEDLGLYVDILKSLINSDDEYSIVLDEEMLLNYPDFILVMAICHEALHIVEDTLEIENIHLICDLISKEYLELEKESGI